MNTKTLSATILFCVCCVMEIFAIIEYFRFPNVLSLQIGLAFAFVGVIFFIFSVYLYRSSKKMK